ncbi:MAG: hypothetical protein Q8P24_04205, partial [Desulfobacterales bacterium]|nr:hypothetical protein [Desulfobacterales bacterium]
TKTHFRDMFGRFLWAEPLKTENRLYNIGEEFIWDVIKYRVERMAIVEFWGLLVRQAGDCGEIAGGVLHVIGARRW